LGARGVFLSSGTAFVRLSRPVSLLGIGLCVATSIRLAGGARPLDGRDAAVLAGWMLLAAGGYVLDDVRDHEIDARVHPARPLPSGLVSPKLAFRVAMGLLAAGAAALARGYAGLWAVGIVTAGLLYAYGESLKRASGLAATAMVSALLAAAAVSGGFRSGEWPAVAVFGLMTFWMNLGREIVMDIADLPEDRRLRYRTIPLIHGARTARRMAAVSLILGGGSGYLLPAAGAVPAAIFVPGLTIINLGLLSWVVVPLATDRDNSQRQVGFIKAAMFAYLALIALHLVVIP